MNSVIYSLLKEARPTTPEIPKDMTDIQAKAALLNALTQSSSLSMDERQLLGRFGVWLLVGLCSPNENTSNEILGRLLSMLFHWFHVTAYTFDGNDFYIYIFCPFIVYLLKYLCNFFLFTTFKNLLQITKYSFRLHNHDVAGSHRYSSFIIYKSQLFDLGLM